MNNWPQRKVILSLSSIMFFALFVRKWLKKWDIILEKIDKEFVWFYIQLWLINTFLLTVCVALFLLGFIFSFPFLSSIWNWILILTISIIFIEILLITIGYYGNLTHKEHHSFDRWNIAYNKGNIIKNYMPFYTIYHRYNFANFERPYRWTKESFFLRTIFTISLFSQNNYIVGLIFFLILFRVVSLYLWIDIISNEYKHKINSLFKINPEEIFGYILGYSKYILNKYIFKKQDTPSFLTEAEWYKQNYSKLKELNTQIITQYIILLIFVVLYIIILPNNLFSLLFVVFILWRYILLLVFERKLPNLPVIYDILKIFYHTPHLDEIH